MYARCDPVNAVDPSGTSPSPAVTGAAVLGTIAAVCGLLAIEAVATFFGIVVSPAFALCAAIAGLGAAIDVLIATLQG